MGAASSAQAIGSNQTRGFRIIKTAPILQDSFQDTVDIPRGPHIETVSIRIQGTINVTTAFTTARDLSPYYMLRRVDWLMNSNVTLDSCPGTSLNQLMITQQSIPPTVTAGVGAGAQTFDMTVYLDRIGLDMARPKDSNLKTDVGVSNLQLRLQFGNLADMFTGAGVATYTNVTYTVGIVDYQEEIVNGTTPSSLYYLKRNGFRYTVPGAGSNQQFRLTTGNRLRIVSMRVLDAVTFEPNIALLTRLKIQRAGDMRVDMSATELRRLNQRSYILGAISAGQILVDFAKIGQATGVKYSEFWPIPSSADTFLYVDTTAACILEIVTLEGVDLVPPK